MDRHWTPALLLSLAQADCAPWVAGTQSPPWEPRSGHAASASAEGLWAVSSCQTASGSPHLLQVQPKHLGISSWTPSFTTQAGTDIRSHRSNPLTTARESTPSSRASSTPGSVPKEQPAKCPPLGTGAKPNPSTVTAGHPAHKLSE